MKSSSPFRPRAFFQCHTAIAVWGSTKISLLGQAGLSAGCGATMPVSLSDYPMGSRPGLVVFAGCRCS